MKIFIFIVFMIWCIPGSYAAIKGIKFLRSDDESIFPTLLVFWYIAFTTIFIISLIRWDILNLGI